MKKLIIICLGIFIPGLLFSQWNTLTEELYVNRCVSFISPDEGWVAGDNGVLRKTTDGGYTWENYFQADSVYFRSIYFINSDIGYACGSIGYGSGSDKVLKTSDGGQTWTEKYSGGSKLECIYFQDMNSGFVAGWNGTILRTTDGGNNWTSVYSDPGLFLFSIHVINDIGYAVGSGGTILKTSDFGVNWTYLPSGTSIGLYSVFMINDASTIIVGYEGIVLKSISEGQSWDVQYIGNQYFRLESVRFTNDSTGYVACYPILLQIGGIFKTTDGGDTWTYQEIENLHTLCFATEEVGYAISIGGNWSDSRIYKTSNAGNSWSCTTPPPATPNDLLSVYFTDDNTGYATGENGTIIKTIDGGNSWEHQNSGTDYHMNSVFFTDAVTGYVVGNIWTNSGLILKTTNAGDTWVVQETCNSHLQAIHFVDSDIGFAVGNGSVMKTTDGGVTWYEQIISDWIYLYSVFFIDKNIGFTGGFVEDYVTTYPKLYKTTDGGNTWSELELTLPGYTVGMVQSICFTDENTGFIVGVYDHYNPLGAEIIKTSDGGLSWTYQMIPQGSSFNSIYFINSDTGYVAGIRSDQGDALICKTTDGGLSWVKEELKGIRGKPLNAVFFPNENTGFAVGDDGSILKKEDQTSGLPDDFITKQTFKLYPNPAKINVTIESDFIGKKRLSILNLHGQLLKSEWMNAESYLLDCSDLKPGIYLISLETRKGLITEKLIIL